MNKKRIISRITVGILILALALTMVPPTQVAGAATITVTSTSDGTGGPDCTLRDAITAADTDAATGGCPAGSGADTVVLASGATYTLSTGNLPAIQSQIIIEGNGSTVERSNADGTPEFRIFYLAEDGDLTLNELTVSNGDSLYDGGGIKNSGALTLNNSTISGNRDSGISTLEGSSVYIYNSTISDNSGGNSAGGISNNRGSVVIYNSTVSGNTDGGIINYLGSVDIVNSSIIGNYRNTNGGGIHNRGALKLTNSTVSDNTAGMDGGGIYNGEEGIATITDSIIGGNISTSNGGGIANYYGTMTFTESTINDNSRGGLSNNRGSVDINNSIISGNYDYPHGGGISNFLGSVDIDSSTVSGNSATSSGGGIYNRGGVLTLANSTVSDNTENGSNAGGGGIHVYDYGELTMINSTVKGNSARQGGGIRIYNNSTATLINSTISENTVLGDTAGGIHIGNVGELTLINSTISYNYGGVGVGIWNSGSSTTRVINSTISHNSPAASYRGAIANYGVLTLENTIVADQLSGYNCVGGPVTSLGYNLDSDGRCNLNATGDLSGIDPLIGPLQDNGGPTQTHALLHSSPAIDAVPATHCNLATDQRGVSRPQGPACDIGSFEVEYVHIDIKPGSNPNSINLESVGVVPVALLTTVDFDARTIDPVTVLFAGASPLRWVMEDVDLDGDVDLLFHFKTRELNLDNSSSEAILSGMTFDGIPILGKDKVRVVP